ncbi:MAG: hypothetical protein JWM12_791 [Ilumatobacteraceae bacterium]|nr:hypothetical protein [Ilumatobacteraceae bacterium]
MDDEELTPEEAATIESFSALLVDESVWGGPSPGLDDLIVAQIAAERTTTPDSDRAADGDWGAAADAPLALVAPVVPITAARGATRRRWWSIAGAAVAGAAAAALITTAVVRNDDTATTAGEQRVELRGTDLAPGAGGAARLSSNRSGVRIDLAVSGLPERIGGDFYQVWLKNCAGTLLVPAGSFHDLADAVAWAGVSLADYPIITVTQESAVGGKDPAQGSSGLIVASANVASCPS